MSTLTEYSLPEKILLAASDLEEEGQTPFSANRESPVCRSAHPSDEAGRTP